MRKVKRVVILAMLLVPLGLVGLFLYARSAFPPERLRMLVEPKLEAALQRPVELDGVSLSFWPLAVRLDGVRIQAPAGFEATSLVRLEALQMRLELLPLLGRRIEIHSLVLEKPRLWLEEKKDGTWNYAVPPTAGPSTPERAATTEADFALTVQKLQIQDGSFEVTRHRTGDSIQGTMASELEIKADRALRDVQLGGWVTIDLPSGVRSIRAEPRVRVSVPDSTVQIERLRLVLDGESIDCTGEVRLQNDALLLQPIEAHLGDSVVRMTGRVAWPFEPQSAVYEIRLDAQLDLGALSRFATLPEATQIEGRMKSDLLVRATKDAPGRLGFEGPLTLEEGVVRTPLLQKPVSFTAKMQGTGEKIRIEKAVLRSGSSECVVTGVLHPVLPPERGAFEFDAQTDRIEIATLLVPPADVPNPTAGRATTTPKRAPLDVRGRFRVQELVLEGARFLDLDVRVQPPAHEAGPLDLQGTLRARAATLDRIDVSALQANLETKDTRVKLTDIRGVAYAGTLRGDGFFDLENPSVPTYEFQVQGEGLKAGAFLGSLIPPLKDVVQGQLGFQSTLRASGRDPKAIQTSLTANGRAACEQGQILGLPILGELGRLLVVPVFEKLSFRETGLQFDVDKGRMVVRDWTLRGPEADFLVGGSIGLDGSLDLDLNVRLSEASSRRYAQTRALGALQSLFADSEGRLVFDFAVKGSHRAPKLRPAVDVTAKRDGLASAAKSSLRGTLEAKAPEAERKIESKLRDLLRPGPKAKPDTSGSGSPKP